MQKLQDKLAKLESLSTEALRATQTESARATQAEAVRYVQTEAVVDSLLAFKQTQAAELAKRDVAIAALHDLVAQLQNQLQQQASVSGHESSATAQLQRPGSANRQVPTATAQLQKEGSAERLTSGPGRQLSSAERPMSTAERQLPTAAARLAGYQTQGSRQVSASTVQQWPVEQKAKGTVKGKVSRSSDGKKGLHKAAGKGQTPEARGPTAAEAVAELQQQQQHCRQPLSEVLLREAREGTDAATDLCMVGFSPLNAASSRRGTHH